MNYQPYQCCQKSFEDYYVHQSGGGLNYYQGANFQRGYGFGGIFRSFFRAAVPLLKSGVKAVGRQLWHSGVDTLKDISRGDDVKVAVRHHLTDKAATKVKTMIGSGRNKKRKRKSKSLITRKSKKARTSRDIFS